MRIGATVVGLGILFGVETARAQEPRAPDADDVPVRISGVESSVSLRIAERETERTVALCQGPCAFRAPRGRYIVIATDTATGERRELGLRLREPSHYRYRPGDSSAKTAGLVVGIAGPVLIFTGFIMVLPALFAATCASDQGCSSESKDNAARLGLGAMLVGAVATPIGWTVFASNRTKLLEVRPGEARHDDFRLRLGVARFGPDSLGLAGVGRF